MPMNLKEYRETVAQRTPEKKRVQSNKNQLSGLFVLDEEFFL